MSSIRLKCYNCGEFFIDEDIIIKCLDCQWDDEQANGIHWGQRIKTLISEFLEDLNKCNIHNYPKELDNIIEKWEEKLNEG